MESIPLLFYFYWGCGFTGRCGTYKIACSPCVPRLRGSVLPNCVALYYSFIRKATQYRSARWGWSSKGLCWGELTCPPHQPLPRGCQSKSRLCHASAPVPSLNTTAAPAALSNRGSSSETSGPGQRLIRPCQIGGSWAPHHLCHAQVIWVSEAFPRVFLVASSEHRADSNLSAVCTLARSGQTLNSKAKGSPLSVII